MEDALARPLFWCVAYLKKCLNPCCNGRCTRTVYKAIIGFDNFKS